MYKLYTWYAWGFGKWVYRGEFETNEEAKEQMKNRFSAAYKIVCNNDVVEYHEAPGNCWRYGQVRSSRKRQKQ